LPAITSSSDPEALSEDLTLLTLYSLAGEDSEGYLTVHIRAFRRFGKQFIPSASPGISPEVIENVVVRELTWSEMARAERELWTHYHQQKADPETDRLFAEFADRKLIGVARCSRHPDGLEVDAVFVLDEYRLKGFARSIMKLLVEECGRSETLYMHSKTELADFYGSMGFYLIQESDLPKSIRDRFDFCMGNLEGISVSPMRRDPRPREDCRGNAA
jgi:N-acetylglutamate synthase-like GNAT family acetyltransferase